MIDSPFGSVIVRRTASLLVSLVQLFALYVLFFGHYGPGGGFVAGVMIAASLIFGLLVFGEDSGTGQRAKRLMAGDGAGLLVFAAVGGLCLIGGGEFLNYAQVPVPGLDSASRRYLGILLAQVGVALDVSVAAVSIVFSLSRNAPDGKSDA
ncbi:MAG: hypothetical protein OXD30_11710 [Bryobacterales bacterium]|nr:hypothetical protein [Bryobacterales bacterium]